MIKTLLLVSLFLSSFINCTDFQIKELKLSVLYNEKTKGTVMNLYSAQIPSNVSPQSDLIVDTKLNNRVGIFDTPLVFLSTVRVLIIKFFIRLHYLTHFPMNLNGSAVNLVMNNALYPLNI